VKILEYIYYRLYYVLQKTNAKDIAEYVASVWLVVLFGLNIIVVVGNFGFNPLKHISSKAYGLILFVPLMLLMYFLFVRDKRYLQLVEQYANETKEQRIRGHLILIVYVVTTFVALILL